MRYTFIATNQAGDNKTFITIDPSGEFDHINSQ